MIQYNRLNTKLSNSPFNKLKSAIKNTNDVVIISSPNMISDSNDQGNFPHELLLTDREVSSIQKVAYQLTLSFQKLSYQKYSQEDF